MEQYKKAEIIVNEKLKNVIFFSGKILAEYLIIKKR